MIEKGLLTKSYIDGFVQYLMSDENRQYLIYYPKFAAKIDEKLFLFGGKPNTFIKDR